MKKWQMVLSLAVVVCATTAVGWGWWNGAGPFRSRSQTQPTEYVNRMEGIEYVNTWVSFGEFLDATSPARWTQEQGKYFAWEGEKIQASPPLVRRPIQRAGVRFTQEQQKELREANNLDRDFTQSLTEVVLEEGYRTLPYRTKDRESIGQASLAQIHAVIKTSRQKHLVIFQSEISLHRHIRTESAVFQHESVTSTKVRSGSRFKKNILQGIQLYRTVSPLYVVDNKEAVKAIESVLKQQAQDAFRYSRLTSVSSGGSVTQDDAQYPLEIDPEADNNSVQNLSLPSQ